ncbi:chitin synthase 3 [Trichomonascus vanleenenianus]|uniref:chitin synthase CHS3 n=1 Tax=Trichomonascus vanleenenianus TaxID=2268995 RepID=UPI003ECAE662
MDRAGSFRRKGSQKRNSGKESDYQSFDAESSAGVEFSRKRSLIRPERSRIEPGHPQYHYTQKAAQQAGRINVLPSTTGNDPVLQEGMQNIPMTEMARPEEIKEESEESSPDLKGAQSVVYGLNDEVGYHRSTSQAGNYGPQHIVDNESPDAPLRDPATGAPAGGRMTPGPKKPVPQAKEGLSLWAAYCKVVTFWAPSFLLSLFGPKTKARQMAWREKMGLITIILYVAACVAYLTFGFTATVCDNTVMRIRNNEVPNEYLIINGRFYDLSKSKHPAAQGISAGSNILYPPVNAGGMDASFLFQNVNGNCKGLITPKANAVIPHNGDDLAYYFPCQVFAQNGTTQPSTEEKHYEGYACHTSATARRAYYNLKVAGEVYFTWDDIKNSTRNLVVYNGNVLDLDLLGWIRADQVDYPSEFDDLRTDDSSLRGTDVSQYMTHGRERKVMKCLTETVKVGYIDTEQIGCIASQVVLYVSLVFIIGIVAVKFVLACYFKWVVSGRQGAFYMDRKQLEEHQRQIEDWSDNIYTQGPIKKAPVYPTARKDRQSKMMGRRGDRNTVHSITMGSQVPSVSTSKLVPGGTFYQGNNSRSSLMMLNQFDGNQSLFSADTSYRGAGMDDESNYTQENPYSPVSPGSSGTLVPGMPDYLVPQPPAGYQPFGFPLAHTICLVTAYSESIDGLRTTLDSIATTDYPNSHKLILIICDGIIKGSGNDLSTPEIALSMMKDFCEPPEETQSYSYVSVVSGSKRHNMAKVYSGFYKYDDDTIEVSKQQRVPMMVIVKTGTPSEAKTAKPGNRGKRDSQIILMSFLQRVMFDERMTELDYEIFNGIWKITGIAPDFYEIVLMVDADTKVFPDSLTHMVAEMVKDPEIMGLCGETKIANKSESWVTMIQVFEYFISHHQAKAFESVFGGVTCLPGCFCMYRIKTPKGADGYWVPILANPDIVERYADNVIDTLHKKNLLLLGEDRFLSTLMLRTFPKRKQIFVPKAACKTIVPNEFKVLLSQRRRWINSTVHNLFELVLVKDLCGVFCISMQFVVFIDLVSTLVLPAAISFTLYVIIIAIVRKPTPIMSLILLALILGLPGLLIVVTAHRVSYVLWMLIYLIALPIWNFVLPMYAYWKFDDFSWGDTRTIEGGDKGGHDEGEGEFDSSQIVMKRWRDFERERRRAIGMPQAPWNNGGSNSMLSSSSNAFGHSRSANNSSEDLHREVNVI